MQPSPQQPRPNAPRQRRPDRANLTHRPNLLIVRALIGVLALTLGIVLIVQGNVLVGGLITALALLRVGVMATMHRRRAQWRAAAATRRAGGPGRRPS